MYPPKEGLWQCGELDVSEFSDKWQFVMDNSTPTCRSLDQPYQGSDKENFLFHMIDGYIVSDNIEVVDVKTVNSLFAPSDHNPVVLNVKLK